MTTPIDRGTEPLAAARQLLESVVRLYRKEPLVAEKAAVHLRRLDEPLRVALVGSVKAGKSTLLNAMLGQHLAPTDARECTRIVTWYRHGATPTIFAHGVGGERTSLPVVRQEGRLELELGDLESESLRRLEVTWPAEVLSELILIDTPGTSSISADVSRRTRDFLAPPDDVSGVDAVVYMLRSLHSSDVDFLRQLRDQNGRSESALGSIAVLSRADEVGGGRLDAMVSVNRAVRAMREDSALEGLVEAVIPVAGLLALAGATLRQSEFSAFVALEKVPRARVRSLLMSADRFITDEDEALPPIQVRAKLVQRFGLYGIRLAIAVLRGGVRDAPTLSSELVRRSGVEALREIVDVNFRQRRDDLKAHSGVMAVQRMLTDHPNPGGRALLETAEDFLENSHAFREMRLLSRVRSGTYTLPSRDKDDLVRLIGGFGAAVHERLGLPETATPAQCHEAALAAMARWVEISEDPLAPVGIASACRDVIRSCEGMVAELVQTSPSA